MTRTWWLGIGSAVALLAALGIVVANVAGRHANASTSDARAAAEVPLATARAGRLTDRIAASGRVGAPAGSSAKLAFAQSGILRVLDVRVGDRVNAGDVLAELDRSALANGVAQAAADARAAAASYGGGRVPDAATRTATSKLALAVQRLATLEHGGPAAASDRIAAQSAARQAALKVDTDRTTLARERTLFAGGVLASKDVDAARAQLDADLADARAADAKVAQAETAFTATLAAARADVAAARSDLATAQAQTGVLGGGAAAAHARLDAARIAFANGALTAPADGTVLALLKHPGEAVDPTTPVLEVGPPNAHTVTLTVPGDVARRIAVGDAATIDVPQTPETRTSARVAAVVPVVDPTTQSATIVLAGAPPGAVPGDAVSATIDVARIAGVLVPSAAIVEDPQTGKTVVFVKLAHVKAGDAPFAMRAVNVRASDGATSVLGDGLRAGERIAAQGGYTLLAPAGG